MLMLANAEINQWRQKSNYLCSSIDFKDVPSNSRCLEKDRRLAYKITTLCWFFFNWMGLIRVQFIEQGSSYMSPTMD